LSASIAVPLPLSGGKTMPSGSLQTSARSDAAYSARPAQEPVRRAGDRTPAAVLPTAGSLPSLRLPASLAAGSDVFRRNASLLRPEDPPATFPPAMRQQDRPERYR